MALPLPLKKKPGSSLGNQVSDSKPFELEDSWALARDDEETENLELEIELPLARGFEGKKEEVKPDPLLELEAYQNSWKYCKKNRDAALANKRSGNGVAETCEQLAEKWQIKMDYYNSKIIALKGQEL